MPRSVQKVGLQIDAYLEVYDNANNPVLGLVNANFTKVLAFNGVLNATVVTVTEVGNGMYEATFTPGVIGSWHLLIRNAANNPRGWDETFDVTAAGPDLTTWVTDGYTYAQMLELTGAALLGKVSGGPANPVFRSMDDTANRISATCDVNGNRIVVNLTP